MAKIIEIFNVSPSSPQELPSQTSLPLTFFDILWLRLPPVQRIFFYEFPHQPSLFFNTLLPKLKQSLSLALSHFYPLSGHLIWPLDSHKPIIKYIKGNSLSLTVAESDADFNLLSGNDLCEATKVHHLLSNLNISHDHASILALQVTLFPNYGFSIGVTSHHAVLDGKNSTSFIKSWAYLCRNLESISESTLSLPNEFRPFYDRKVINDPDGLEAKYLSAWLKQGGTNNRSLKVWDLEVPEDSVRGLFQLSRLDIEKLKKFVVSKQKGARNENENLHLSTFLVSIAYACVCRVKAEEIKNKNVIIALNIDCRNRLDPPIPATYFGNCIGARLAVVETSEILGEDGLIVVVKLLSEALETLKDGVLNGAEDWSSWLLDGVAIADVKTSGTAGSPKFEVYSTDFGCGKPKKVEMVSIDRTGAICISDCGNGDGVEIGIVAKKKAMEAFASLFVNGITS
ncbi:phenolic glucoside malonyltransferase 1-like [Vicia villosa]|uniref:phenolic glucoside malonyltransferase 1-like n=1 Tax=Vicia villosa TaxID=3911 RepID=UPI00273AC7A7|nr:phenolic glucoside malonyltransferase 1-like [Vicia villosa]